MEAKAFADAMAGNKPSAPDIAAALRLQVTKINASAPAEIRNDWVTVSPVFEDLAKQLEAPSAAFPGKIAAYQQNQAFVAAALRVFDSQEDVRDRRVGHARHQVAEDRRDRPTWTYPDPAQRRRADDDEHRQCGDDQERHRQRRRVGDAADAGRGDQARAVGDRGHAGDLLARLRPGVAGRGEGERYDDGDAEPDEGEAADGQDRRAEAATVSAPRWPRYRRAGRSAPDRTGPRSGRRSIGPAPSSRRSRRRRRPRRPGRRGRRR